MRRDVMHYYERSIADVYGAYKAAAMQKFGKDCREEPYHTLSFGLNYSFRYNMNGGACTVHFMPYNTGTAVNIRYSIVQLAGARYGAHDKEMSTFVTSVLGVPAMDLKIDPEIFLLEQNKVYAGSYTTPAAPAYQPAPPVQQPVQTYQPAPAASPKFCARCGNRLSPGAKFCGGCGNKIL